MPTSRRTVRIARLALAAIAVIGLALAAVVISHRRQNNKNAATASASVSPSVFKTVALTTGTLSTKETLDGSVVLSKATVVLHRIDGQTSVASTPANNGGPANGAAAGTGAAAPSGILTQALAATRALAADCAGAGASATPTTTDAGTTTTTITTAGVPFDPTSTTNATPTSTGAADTTTTMAGPATTVALPCGSTAATTTTVAGGVSPGGGFGGFGGASSGVTGGGAAPAATGAAASARVTQTVTSMIHTGAVVNLGDVLYTVDSHPVVVLAGVLPAWRTLSTASTDGPDVQQLEASLRWLGYDPTGSMTVDDTFDAATAKVVKTWQAGLGEEQTGKVTLGSVVFLAESTTVSSVSAAVGDQVSDGSSIVTVAAATQQVVVEVPSADQAVVVPGLAVNVGTVAATITSPRSVERNGAVSVEAVINPSAPIEGADNGATVKVSLVLDSKSDVLIGPAEAVLSRLDGTYAVQVQIASGAIEWVTVEVLGVSGGNVGVSGDGLAEGILLVVPA